MFCWAVCKMSLTRMPLWSTAFRMKSLSLSSHKKKKKSHIILISLEGRRRGIISACKFSELLCSSKSCDYKQRRRVYVDTHPHTSYCRYHCCGVLPEIASERSFLSCTLVGVCWHDIFCFLFVCSCRHPPTAEVYNEWEQKVCPLFSHAQTHLKYLPALCGQCKSDLPPVPRKTVGF